VDLFLRKNPLVFPDPTPGSLRHLVKSSQFSLADAFYCFFGERSCGAYAGEIKFSIPLLVAHFTILIAC
jgi:hypothetical protein